MKILKINMTIGHYCSGCGQTVRYSPCPNCG